MRMPPIVFVFSLIQYVFIYIIGVTQATTQPFISVYRCPSVFAFDFILFILKS